MPGSIARNELVTAISSQVVTPKRFHHLLSRAFPNPENLTPKGQKSLDQIASLAFTKLNIAAIEALENYGYDFSARRWYKPHQLKQFIVGIENRLRCRGIQNTLEYRQVKVLKIVVQFGTQLYIDNEHVLDYLNKERKSDNNIQIIFNNIYQYEYARNKKIVRVVLYNQILIFPDPVLDMVIAYLGPFILK